jgi:hypothetical protein
MYSKDLLINPEMPPIVDANFLQLKADITKGIKLDQSIDPHNQFIVQA